MAYLLNLLVRCLMLRDVRVSLPDLVLKLKYSELKLGYLVLIIRWREVVLW